jgi:hypothetical protein
MKTLTPLGSILLAMSCLGASTLSAGTASVYFNDRKQIVSIYGGDFKLRVDTWKNPRCWMSLAPAQQDLLVTWINELNLDVLRIPIYSEAQPSAGNYDGSVYNNVKSLMNRFPGKTFFASPAEDGNGGWPAFMGSGSNLDTVAYNGWISKSLTTLSGAQYVSHLGPFNEDGGIPPSKKWKVFNNFPGRTRIGPDSWSLITAAEEAGTIATGSNKLSYYIDVGGSHAYNHQDSYLDNFHGEWSAVAAEFPGKPMWATEATGYGMSIAQGVGYVLNALKGNVTGVIQYQILGQIIQFASDTTLATRNGRYYALKAFINQTRGKRRIGSSITSGMTGSVLVAFDQGSNKVCVIVANPGGTTNTYTISGRNVSSAVRYDYNEGTASDPAPVAVVSHTSTTFTDNSAAEAVFYVVTLQP